MFGKRPQRAGWLRLARDTKAANVSAGNSALFGDSFCCILYDERKVRQMEPLPLVAFCVLGGLAVVFVTTNIVKEIREIRKLPATDGDVTALTILITVLGGLVGGLLGFLFRPSAPVIGQLPFDAVITRGSDLKGIDGLLKPTAEVSFNYVLGGAIIGGVVFAAWRHLTVRRRSERSPQ